MPRWPTASELANALASGKYVKGHGSLISQYIDDEGGVHNAYCCLGVCGALAGLTRQEMRPYSFLSSFARDQDNPEEYLPEWMNLDIETNLAIGNDESDSWSKVIDYLRSL